MGDVNLEIKLNNIDERVIKIEESGGSGGDGYITSVSNDFNVLNKKLSLSNDVTTKLSKVDTTDNLSVELAKKIDKPVSATNGQVLTYNGTSNEWEAQDSKGGGSGTARVNVSDIPSSITEPTDLEKGIIGGDEWVSGGSYTIGKSVVIDENKLYLLVGDGGSTTKPSTDATHSIWEETSISALNSKSNSSLLTLDYDNMVDLSGILNASGKTYTPTKSGMIMCKAQAGAQNCGIGLKQGGVEIMFLNIYNQYARGSSQVIVNPEEVTLYQLQNAKIESFKFIPFK